MAPRKTKFSGTGGGERWGKRVRGVVEGLPRLVSHPMADAKMQRRPASVTSNSRAAKTMKTEFAMPSCREVPGGTLLRPTGTRRWCEAARQLRRDLRYGSPAAATVRQIVERCRKGGHPRPRSSFRKRTIFTASLRGPGLISNEECPPKRVSVHFSPALVACNEPDESSLDWYHHVDGSQRDTRGTDGHCLDVR